MHTKLVIAMTPDLLTVVGVAMLDYTSDW